VAPELVLAVPIATAHDGFEAVMRTHERRVLGLALRLTGNLDDAQDAAQEVFLRLHRNLGSLEADAIAPWLRRVTVNVCLDARRRNSRAAVAIDRDHPSQAPGPEVEAERGRRREALQAALGRLGEKERAALVLRDLEGLSTAEVAAALGSSEATVRVQISKARLKLREWLRGLR
jgi:RNA polymerase sigma-70 factor (ECF subfamily)